VFVQDLNLSPQNGYIFFYIGFQLVSNNTTNILLWIKVVNLDEVMNSSRSQNLMVAFLDVMSSFTLLAFTLPNWIFMEFGDNSLDILPH